MDSIENDMKLLLSSLSFSKDDVDQQIQALRTLATMCSNEGGSQRLHKLGGLKIITSLFCNASLPAIKQWSLYVLSNAVQDYVPSKKLMCIPEMMRKIDQLLNSKKLNVLSVFGANFLLALCSSYGPGQDLTRTSGCLEKLLSIYQSTTPRSDVWFDAPDNVAKNLWTTVSSALCSAINDPQNDTNKVICGDLLPQAISMLKNTHNDILCTSLNFIGHTISNNGSTQRMFQLVSGFNALIALLKRIGARSDADGADLISLTLQTISCGLTHFEENKKIVGSLDMIPLLIGILNDDRTTECVLSSSLVCLSRCIDNCDHNRRRMFDCNGLQTLISMLIMTKNEEMRKVTLFTLQSCLPIPNDKLAAIDSRLLSNVVTAKSSALDILLGQKPIEDQRNLSQHPTLDLSAKDSINEKTESAIGWQRGRHVSNDSGLISLNAESRNITSQSPYTSKQISYSALHKTVNSRKGRRETVADSSGEGFYEQGILQGQVCINEYAANSRHHEALFGEESCARGDLSKAERLPKNNARRYVLTTGRSNSHDQALSLNKVPLNNQYTSSINSWSASNNQIQRSAWKQGVEMLGNVDSTVGGSCRSSVIVSAPNRMRRAASVLSARTGAVHSGNRASSICSRDSRMEEIEERRMIQARQILKPDGTTRSRRATGSHGAYRSQYVSMTPKSSASHRSKQLDFSRSGGISRSCDASKSHGVDDDSRGPFNKIGIFGHSRETCRSAIIPESNKKGNKDDSREMPHSCRGSVSRETFKVPYFKVPSSTPHFVQSRGHTLVKNPTRLSATTVMNSLHKSTKKHRTYSVHGDSIKEGVVADQGTADDAISYIESIGGESLKITINQNDVRQVCSLPMIMQSVDCFNVDDTQNHVLDVMSNDGIAGEDKSFEVKRNDEMPACDAENPSMKSVKKREVKRMYTTRTYRNVKQRSQGKPGVLVGIPALEQSTQEKVNGWIAKSMQAKNEVESFVTDMSAIREQKERPRMEEHSDCINMESPPGSSENLAIASPADQSMTPSDALPTRLANVGCKVRRILAFNQNEAVNEEKDNSDSNSMDPIREKPDQPGDFMSEVSSPSQDVPQSSLDHQKSDLRVSENTDESPVKETSNEKCLGCFPFARFPLFVLNSRNCVCALRKDLYTCDFHKAMICNDQMVGREIFEKCQSVKAEDRITSNINKLKDLEIGSTRLPDLRDSSGRDLADSPLKDVSDKETAKQSMNYQTYGTSSSVYTTQSGMIRRKRQNYEECEIDNIYKGMKRYGRRWNAILNAYKFKHGRTAEDLKDKYKQLNKIKQSSNGTAASTAEKSHERLPFTSQEIVNLKIGFGRYGARWKTILNSFKFQGGRTANDLQQKFANVLKRF